MIHYNSDCSIFEVKDLNQKDRPNKIVKISGNSTCIANEVKIMKLARCKYNSRKINIDGDKYKFNIPYLYA